MALREERLFHGAERNAGLLCYPDHARLPLPAVIVLSEVWGLDATTESITRRFASAGYAAFAPDLLCEGGERPPSISRERVAELQGFLFTAAPGAWMDPQKRAEALAKRPGDERARLEQTFGELFANLGTGGSRLPEKVPRIQAAARWLRMECAASLGQPTGVVGFCMGGGLSALLACHDPDLKAAVIFYGSSPPQDLVPNIRCPVLGHYGERDQRINDGVPAFAQAMEKYGKSFERHTYPGAHHSFFNDDNPGYNVGAAREAFSRTLEFFRSHLVT